jgi:hypothetical protein
MLISSKKEMVSHLKRHINILYSRESRRRKPNLSLSKEASVEERKRKGEGVYKKEARKNE